MSWLKRTFVHQWHRKLTAVIAAVIIWVLVDHAITLTRSVPNVAVRILNIPEGMTVRGLLPNGLLSKRLNLTITGDKRTLRELSPSDLEVVVDAAGKGDRWTTLIKKRNLKSLTDEVDIARDISGITPIEFTVELSRLVTEKIPITITRPIGEAPQGFVFLDVWPQQLYQEVSGPKQQVDGLKAKGLKLTFDLSKITKEELEELYQKTAHLSEDEIRFFVPKSWKVVTIPFAEGRLIEVNGAEADYLHLDFLRQELLPIQGKLPVAAFYPTDTLEAINPIKFPLRASPALEAHHGVFLLAQPLLAKGISRLFLEAIQERIQLVLIAKDQDRLTWSVEYINAPALEKQYIDASVAALPEEERAQLPSQYQETFLRNRFNSYMRSLELFDESKEPLELNGRLETDGILLVGPEQP